MTEYEKGNLLNSAQNQVMNIYLRNKKHYARDRSRYLTDYWSYSYYNNVLLIVDLQIINKIDIEFFGC